MPWDFALIYAVLAFFAPWRGAVKVREILAAPPDDIPDRRVIYISSAATQWAIAATVLWRARVRGFSWNDLGLVGRSPGILVIVGLGFAGYLIAIQLFVIRRALRIRPGVVHQSRAMLVMRRLMPAERPEVPAFVLLAATAGICEEFLYRGFVYSHFEKLAGVGAALVGSSVLFGIAHIYQGRQGAIGTLIIGLVLAASRLWTGSLLPGAIAHFLFDLSAGLLVAKWVRRAAVVAPLEDGA